jgi:hypothetical protein
MIGRRGNERKQRLLSPIRSVRRLVAKKYLDWAEVLPSFNGGLLRYLQSLRKRQRRDADKANADTRPTSDLSMRFDKILLLEMFLIEDYDDLDRQLRRLFSGADVDRYLNDFSDSARDLYSGRWTVVGRIGKDPVTRYSFSPFAMARMAELPDEVRWIDVRLSKILPSLFVIAFQVELNEVASTNLRDLLNKKYLSEVSFSGFLPTRKGLRNHSSLPSEQVMRRKIEAHFENLRVRIERQLRTRIQGYFLSPGSDSKACLPAIEMLSIEGADPKLSTAVQLLNSRRWADSFGVRAWLDQALFSCDTLLFQWEFDEEWASTSFRLVTSSQNRDDGSFESIASKFNFACQSLTPFVAFIGFLNVTQEKIEHLRVSVYRTLSGKGVFKRLRREIRLNNDAQLSQMILDRLKFELKDGAWLRISTQELREYHCVNTKEGRPLGSVFLDRINYRTGSLTGYSSMLSRQLSDYLQRRNLDLTFKLQKRLFWWTIVLMVLTIMVSMLAVYPVVKDWPSFAKLLHLFRK